MHSSNIPFNGILLRYQKISIKGKKSAHLENQLRNTVKYLLREIDSLDFYYDQGRIAIAKEERLPFSSEELQIIDKQLPKIFGIKSYSICFFGIPNWQYIKKTIIQNFPLIHQDYLQKNPQTEFIPFRIRTKRSFKKFPLSSNDIETTLLTELHKDYKNLKLNLNHAKLSINIEIRHDASFIYFDTFQSSGLSLGSNSSLLALINYDKNSAAACYQMMRCGSRIHMLHFSLQSDIPTDINKLVNAINDFQYKGTFFICNMQKAHQVIDQNCSQRLSPLIYERLKERVATIIAHYSKLNTIVTAESLATTNYTLDSLANLGKVTNLSIMRPLLNMNNDEIETIAKKAGEFPQQGMNKLPIDIIKEDILIKQESKINLEELIVESLQQTRLIEIKTQKAYPLESLVHFHQKNE